MMTAAFFAANYLVYGAFVVWAFNDIGNRRNRGYTIWNQICADDEGMLSSVATWLLIQGIFLVCWPVCYAYIVYRVRSPES